MLKIGLTGGIASGKSAVGEMFVKLGAKLIQSDSVARELMQPGETVYEEVVARFGRRILNQDGTINRAKLAECAFSAPDQKSPRFQELNAIVHPAVIAWENKWMLQIEQLDPNSVVIVEAALILESGALDRFDHLIVVTCLPEQRVTRFAKRHGISQDAAQAEVKRRMAAQLPDEEKLKAADFVINNSGSLEETERQVRTIFDKITSPPAS